MQSTLFAADDCDRRRSRHPHRKHVDPVNRISSFFAFATLNSELWQTARDGRPNAAEISTQLPPLPS